MAAASARATRSCGSAASRQPALSASATELAAAALDSSWLASPSSRTASRMTLLDRHSIAEASPHSCSSSCASSAARHAHCAREHAPSAAAPLRATSCARSSPRIWLTSKERARASCCRRASVTRSDESCSLMADALSAAPSSSAHRTSARSVCASTEAHRN